MRHGKSFNHLGRTAPHRQALLSNMASSLIIKKRITTTVAKAKALRKYVEPLLTRAKDDTTQSRRVVFSYLQNKDSVQTLFNEVAGKIADRPGGYTRIIKLAETRLGDSSDMAIIELVDYNDLLLEDDSTKKGRTRRSRRGKKSSQQASAATSDNVKTEAKADEAEAKAEDTEADTTAEAADTDTAPKAEAKADDTAEASGSEETKADDDKNKKDQE